MRTADRPQPFRVVISQDESIVLYRGGECVGPYDETTLDLAENLQRECADQPRPGLLRSLYLRIFPRDCCATLGRQR